MKAVGGAAMPTHQPPRFRTLRALVTFPSRKRLLVVTALLLLALVLAQGVTCGWSLLANGGTFYIALSAGYFQVSHDNTYIDPYAGVAYFRWMSVFFIPTATQFTFYNGFSIIFPAWFGLLLMGFVGLIVPRRSKTRGPRCSRCGYSLIGLAEHRPCPECGQTLVPGNRTS